MEKIRFLVGVPYKPYLLIAGRPLPIPWPVERGQISSRQRAPPTRAPTLQTSFQTYACSNS